MSRRLPQMKATASVPVCTRTIPVGARERISSGARGVSTNIPPHQSHFGDQKEY